MTPFLSFRGPLIALAAGALLGLSQPGQAATVVQDLNFRLSPLTSLSGPGGWVATDEQTQLFQQFNPALGTLTAARWELSSVWVAFGEASVASLHTDPNAAVSGLFRLELGLDTRVNAAGSLRGTGGQYFSQDRQVNQACTTSAAAGACLIPLEFHGEFDGVIQAQDLAALTGDGDFEQGVETALFIGNSVLSTPANGAEISSFGQLIWADRDDRGGIGRLRLVYEFDAFDVPGGHVPEPASIALVGIALVALRRARRQP